jgi:predicted kinase
MYNKLILTSGLPRSGKTRWALKQGHPIVSRDAIRIALYGKIYFQAAEEMVTAIESYMVKALFLAGHDTVIVDATHLKKRYIDRWENIMWDLQVHKIDTPADVCIERAKKDGKEELIPIIKAMAKPEYFDK